MLVGKYFATYAECGVCMVREGPSTDGCFQVGLLLRMCGYDHRLSLEKVHGSEDHAPDDPGTSTSSPHHDLPEAEKC